MTIEDLIQLHTDRLALLSQYLRIAHLGRRDKESAVARKVRRRLIRQIEEMIDYEQDMLDVEQSYLHRTTEADRAQDERAEPGWCDAGDTFTCDFDRVALLDTAPLVEDGRAYDYSMGRWYRVEEGYPKKITVPAEDLGDLAVLIARIEINLDIGFTVERFAWTENMLAQWVLANEFRDTYSTTLPG